MWRMASIRCIAPASFAHAHTPGGGATIALRLRVSHTRTRRWADSRGPAAWQAAPERPCETIREFPRGSEKKSARTRRPVWTFKNTRIQAKVLRRPKAGEYARGERNLGASSGGRMKASSDYDSDDDAP